MENQSSILNFVSNDLGLGPEVLDFRFPIETLDSFLKNFIRGFEEASFLVQVNSTYTSTKLKKLSNSYVLEIPHSINSNEQIYIGIADKLSFLILFDEMSSTSRLLLTFDYEKISRVFEYFFEFVSPQMNTAENEILNKLKNIKPKELSPYYLSKFQESLLINSLNTNNKIKQDKLLQAISCTNDLILITDLNGVIKEANKTFIDKYNSSQSIKNINQFIPQEMLKGCFKDVLTGKSWQQEVIKDKSILLVSCNLFKDEIGRASGFVYSVKDITTLRKLDYVNKQLISKLRAKNVELYAANKRLIEMDKAKSDLLAVVNHELKTPVSAILGFSELISQREQDLSQIKSYANEINSSAKRLNTLLSNYLDVATNQLKANTDTKQINLKELISSSYASVVKSFNSELYKFEISSIGYDPVIFAEKDNLEKLFSNILDNAMKYSPKGGKISAQILNDGSNVTISISDEGIGLSQDQTSHIFDVFYRTDNSMTREFSGTGLGLAVCKKIVEIYNGSIWCEPGLEKGTVFYVTLPVNVYQNKADILSESAHKIYQS